MFKGLGGLADMGKMMKAAQEMQTKMAQLQEDLHGMTVTGEELQGGRCRNNCVVCRACQGQVKVLSGKAKPNDASFTVSDYNFSVDSKLIEKAEAIIIDACGCIPMVSLAKAIM